MDSLTAIKAAACAAIDAASADLHDVSRGLWSEPELSFQETKAHARLTEFLERRGFQVTRHYILDTGFKATISTPDDSDDVTQGHAGRSRSRSRGGHVGLMCEYDALPGVGHACGHNLIAEVALAAGLGLQAVMTSLPAGSRATVFGTPAEEGGAGKVAMATGGAFEGLDAAMMAHPYRRNEARPLILSRLALIAEFTPASASAQEADGGWGGDGADAGPNPTDAAVTAYQAASCLRRRFRRHCLMHCVLRECDSPRPDLTPRRAVLEYYLRAPNKSDFVELRRQLTGCFEAAAAATGCRVSVTESGPAYQSVLSNRLLSDAYAANLRSLGIACLETDSDEPAGSTDMGNVSHLVPSIHPMWRLLDPDAPDAETPPNHSHEFTRLSGHPAAQADALSQAKSLAMTAIEILARPEFMESVRREFSG